MPIMPIAGKWEKMIEMIDVCERINNKFCVCVCVCLCVYVGAEKDAAYTGSLAPPSPSAHNDPDLLSLPCTRLKGHHHSVHETPA